MANSLTLAGIETIGNDASNDPRYVLATGIDFGAVTPDTTTITSLLLDGDIVSGERTGNRTWGFTIHVLSSTRAALSAGVDALLAALNVDSFPVVWTPDGCASGVVMTRGRPTLNVEKMILKNDQLAMSVTLGFETGPFLSSTAPQTVTVAPVGGPGQVQLDGMNSGSFTGATLDPTTKYEGAGSAAVTLSRFGGHYLFPATAGRSISPIDLSSFASVSVRYRAFLSTFSGGPPGTAGLVLGLTVSGFTETIAAPVVSIARLDSSWHLVTFDIAAVASTLTAVTAWSISGSQATLTAGAPPTVTVNIDDLRAWPPGSVGNSTPEGALLLIPAVTGSARTPVSIEAARAGIPLTTTGVNTLTAADSSFETGSVGNWGFTTNCSLAVVATGLKATHSLEFTATAAGNCSAFSPVGSTQLPVMPNTVYTLIGSSHAVATPRTFSVGVFWSDINGNIIGSSNSGPVTDTTSGYATAQANVTSPAGAVSANLSISYTGCAASEKHDADGIGLIIGVSQTWVIGTGTTVTVPLTFTDLYLHSPPAGQDPDVAIWLGLSGGGTVTVPAVNMNYDGTYTPVVLFSASATASRVLTLTVTQKIGAITVATSVQTMTVVGAQSTLALPNLTLPLVKVPAENNNGSLIIAVTSSNGTDAFSDIGLADTQGQTLIATGLAAGNDGIWVDQPDPLVNVGDVYQSATDRTGAFSAMSALDAYTGPILFEPGNNKLVAASTAGAPTVAVTYPPSWLDEAQV